MLRGAFQQLRPNPCRATCLGVIRPNTTTSISFKAFNSTINGKATPKVNSSNSLRYLGFGSLALLSATAITTKYLLSDDASIQLQKQFDTPVDRVEAVRNPDPRTAFQGKSISDLVLSLLVYKLCNMSFLMDAAPTILSILDSLHISTPAYFFIKKTIFKQFCGGEDRPDVVPFMNELKQANIGSILDFSIEGDLPAEGDTRSLEELRLAANKHADFVTDQYVQAVKTASALPGSFIAVKVTGLVAPQLLEKSTSILHYLRNAFILADANKDGILTRNEFQAIAEKLPGANKTSINEALSAADPKRSNKIDWISFLASLSMVKPKSAKLYIGENEHVDAETSSKVHFGVDFFSKAEREDLDKLMDRLKAISNEAVNSGVRLMIDAEQSYFQAAIDLVANELSQAFNRESPIVFNTYQMYLKESYEKMRNDLIHAKRDGWCFGAKLVRGAYMVSERKRAADLGLPDIVQDTIENTHQDYNAGVELLLNELAANQNKDTRPLNFMVASHNKESVVMTCQKMQDLGIEPTSGSVLFGQLMGMHDPTTYALASQGYAAFKYIPYGPVREVMPYLIRRAQENSAVMSDMSSEETALKMEIRRRLFPVKDTVPSVSVSN